MPAGPSPSDSIAPPLCTCACSRTPCGGAHLSRLRSSMPAGLYTLRRVLLPVGAMKALVMHAHESAERGEVLARLDRLEQRVGNVVVVDHEQALDELLGVGGHAIAQRRSPRPRRAPPCCAGRRASSRRRSPSRTGARASRWRSRRACARACARSRPLVGGQELQELHLGEPLAGCHVRHLDHEVEDVPVLPRRRAGCGRGHPRCPCRWQASASRLEKRSTRSRSSSRTP